MNHYSFVVISECLTHDAVAVYLFIKKLINFLKSKIENISKIYYVTDGAASQYKNKKNFKNVIKHYDDFGIECEWHFHDTSHGKGPCDGIGGTVKRKAARYSLTNEASITSARELFEWANTDNFSINFDYATIEEYDVTAKLLEKRFINLKTIPGTQSYHAFIPQSKYGDKLLLKKFSNSSNFLYSHKF